MLLVTGLACLAGNLHVMAQRTLVAREVEGVLASKERRTEKHPGLDDVVLWHLEDGRTLQVTDVVDELAPRGARLSKAAWERSLRVDGEARALPWSDDVVGMARVAGPAVLVLLVLTVACLRRGRPAPAREARSPTVGA